MPQPCATWPWIRRSSILASRSATLEDDDPRLPLGFHAGKEFVQGEYVPVVEEFEEHGEVDAARAAHDAIVKRGTARRDAAGSRGQVAEQNLSLIHISEPTRLLSISYAVF